MDVLPYRGNEARDGIRWTRLPLRLYDRYRLMIVFSCHTCKTSLSAEEAMAGTLVRCSSCRTTMQVPRQMAEPAMTVAAPPIPPRLPAMETGPGLTTAGLRRYGFNCPCCSSCLEATSAMGGKDGQCPTCGSNIAIPILDRHGRLIDPRTRQVIRKELQPVHAYAAAGDRAPQILRNRDGTQNIKCVRCGTLNSITANNCRQCGMPFTMEGTAVGASGASNGFCVASLVLGIIGLPAACTFIAPLLAIGLGIIGYIQVSRAGVQRGGKGMAIAGMICGGAGLLLAVLFISIN